MQTISNGDNSLIGLDRGEGRRNVVFVFMLKFDKYVIYRVRRQRGSNWVHYSQILLCQEKFLYSFLYNKNKNLASQKCIPAKS